MSQLDEKVRNILGRIFLVEEIEKIAEENNLEYQWQNNTCFKEFIKALEHHISIYENDWDKNDNFLELSSAIHNEIIRKLNEKGEEKMTMPAVVAATTTTPASTATIATATTATTVTIGTLAIVSGISLLIGIAIGVYYTNKKNQSNKAQDISKNPENDRNTPQLTTAATALQPPKNLTPSYGKYDLLLIIPANQLDDKLTQDSVISKNDTEKLIANAMRVYCFKEGDQEGQKTLNAVDFSEETINFQIESRVFLHLSLMATPDIKKQDKLSIREAVKSDQKVEIKKLKKMGSLHSIREFYSI